MTSLFENIDVKLKANGVYTIDFEENSYIPPPFGSNQLESVALVNMIAEYM